MIPTYTAARATLATSISSSTTGWDVFDHPRAKMTARTIALAPRSSKLFARDRYWREIIVGCFVPTADLAEGIAALEAVAVDVMSAAGDVNGKLTESDAPIEITVAGDDYLAQFHLVEIETST